MGKIKHQPITSRTEDRTTFFYYTFRNILLISLPLVLISALILFHSSSHSSATISNSESDNLTLTLSTSCTIRSDVEEAHNASLHGGQYEDEIGSTKINAYCNDNNGYSIYAVGSSGDIDGNTDLISSLNNNNYNIHTGIYDSSSITASSPSTWSMKLTAGIGTGIDSSSGSSITTTPPTIRNGYDNYSLVPSVYTLVASRDSKTDMSTDTNATGSYFTTTYDIYASSTQQAGTYTGKVKYLMVHPQSNIPYWANTIEESFASAGKQKVYSSKAGGYYYSMQDMTTNICNYVVGDDESTSAQLVDIRDGNIYWVTKLKDGHCWMTQNLDLAIGSTNTPLTSENTDINPASSGSGIYDTANGGYSENNGVWTWTPASTAITSGRTINYSNNSVSNWGTNNNTPYSAEGGDTYFYTSDSYTNDTKYTSLSACTTTNHSEADCKHYHVGNFYSYAAAIASNNSASIFANYSVAANSICPKGWRLPIATNNNQSIYEFGDLLYDYSIITGKTSTTYTANGFNNIRKNPLWFVRSGSIYNNLLNDSATYGNYWSSANVSDYAAYRFGFNNSNITPARDDGGRYAGRPIRCLTK